MKNGHIQTAIKALEKQVSKFNDYKILFRNRAQEADIKADFYGDQAERLQQQIKALRNEIESVEEKPLECLTL